MPKARVNESGIVMLTIPQVAKRFARGYNTIKRWVDRGAFPNVELGYRDGMTLIPETDVENLRASLRAKVVKRAQRQAAA